MTRYPNLLELMKYYPCGEPAVCGHAGIEPELLHAVLNVGETLEQLELVGLMRLYGCSAGVLGCPRVIWLDMGRQRHRKMVDEVNSIYEQLKATAEEGNQEAARYLEWAIWRFEIFAHAVHTNGLSHCHYLGVKERFTQYVRFATPVARRRGLR